jgi:D-glycero-D-manno-heptose 1,7-bisphosphate phosphatase
MSRAIFLDRDGIINEKAPEGDYVTRWEDFRMLPGVAEAIRSLKSGGFKIIVVTNQRCIAKGLITVPELESLHERMLGILKQSGASIDAIYHCPHEVDDFCKCRKPEAGMLFEAARAHDVDLQASWMIGDSDSDVQAGKNAGCKTARLIAPRPHEERSGFPRADVFAATLLDASRQILQLERIPGTQRDPRIETIV